MLLTIVAAIDEQGLIGKNNTLPWKISADLQRFRRITMGKPIIMGRNTYQSIGKPLPSRKNIIISKKHHDNIKGCTVAHSLVEALKVCKCADEVMVIGGGLLYQEALPRADKLYLTLVHAKLSGDTWFPKGWRQYGWQQLSREDHLADDNNEYDYSFVVYQKIK